MREMATIKMRKNMGHYRHEFPKAAVDALAKRVGNRCSNPACRKLTSGPHTDNAKAVTVAVDEQL